MSKEYLEVGDVVRLISNEMQMTVEGVSNPGTMLKVAWFDVHGNLNRASLSKDLVVFVR